MGADWRFVPEAVQEEVTTGSTVRLRRRREVGPRIDAPSELPVNPIRVRSRNVPNF